MRALWERVVDPPELPEGVREALRKQASVNSAGFDPWGLDLDTAEATIRRLAWLYTDYFRVRCRGIENVPEGPVMLVPNHGGQLPLDGMMVGLSMVLDAKHPRIVRGMVERWFPSLPFVSTLFTRCGQVVGDPENCKELLRRGQTIMVFPEGVRGSGKLYWDRYRLQEFGTGFVRIALETGTPIVPVAVVGTEETYPAVWNVKTLAKALGFPYFPVTPFFPLLGPVGALPLPVQIDLSFGEPMELEGDPDGGDEDVVGLVDEVKARIAEQIDEVLAEPLRAQRVNQSI